jgi:hypothetical protein
MEKEESVSRSSAGKVRLATAIHHNSVLQRRTRMLQKILSQQYERCRNSFCKMTGDNISKFVVAL